MTDRPTTQPFSRDPLCEALGITARTLRRYVRSGRVRLVRTSGRYFYFPQEPLEALRRSSPEQPVAKRAEAAAELRLGAFLDLASQVVPVTAHLLALEKLAAMAAQLVELNDVTRQSQLECERLRHALAAQQSVGTSLKAEARELRVMLGMLRAECDAALAGAGSSSFPRLVPRQPDRDEH